MSTYIIQAEGRRLSVAGITPMMPLSALVAGAAAQLGLPPDALHACTLSANGKVLADLTTPIRFANGLGGTARLELKTGREAVLGFGRAAQGGGATTSLPAAPAPAGPAPTAPPPPPPPTRATCPPPPPAAAAGPGGTSLPPRPPPPAALLGRPPPQQAPPPAMDDMPVPPTPGDPYGLGRPVHVFTRDAAARAAVQAPRTTAAAATAAAPSRGGPDDDDPAFFEFTAADYRAVSASYARARAAATAAAAALRTAAQREAAVAAAAAAAGDVRVRVCLPDGLILQARLPAASPLSALATLVARALHPDWPARLYGSGWELYTTPPRAALLRIEPPGTQQQPGGGGGGAASPTASTAGPFPPTTSLWCAGLAPAANVHCGLPLKAVGTDAAPPRLRDEIVAAAGDAPAPAPVPAVVEEEVMAGGGGGAVVGALAGGGGGGGGGSSRGGGKAPKWLKL